jgi:ACS family pantothenate transporter-like MFS transporter
MADAKQAGLTAMPVDALDNDSNHTKNATSLTTPAASDTQKKSSLWRRVLSFIWDSADGDPEYRRYVQRLDLFLL